MFNFIHRLFNHDKIDDLNSTIEVYRGRNKQLEKEVEELKEYRLKYRVTKMYVDDDEALLELLDAAKKKERPYYPSHQDAALAAQQSAMFGMGAAGNIGLLGTVGGASWR